jgi:hypothetical protein
MVPADFFRDQLSGDNFLRGALTQLFECARARTHAPRTAHSIVHHTTQRLDVPVRNPVRSRGCRQGRSFGLSRVCAFVFRCFVWVLAGEGVPQLPQIKQLRKFALRRFELKPAELQPDEDFDDGPVVVREAPIRAVGDADADGLSDDDASGAGDARHATDVEMADRPSRCEDAGVPERMGWMLPPPGCS